MRGQPVSISQKVPAKIGFSRLIEAFVRAFWVVAATAPALGTSPSTALSQEPTVWDSAGIQVVESSVSAADVPEFRILGPPLALIGGAEGDHGSELTWILSARFLGTDLVAVADYPARDIRVFDVRTGDLTHTIGRAGEGPGEFGAAPTISSGVSQDVWAWDPGNRRLSRFSWDGQLLEEHRVSPSVPIPAAFGFNVWTVSSSGRVISTGQAPRRPGLREQRVILFDPRSGRNVQLGVPTMREDLMDDGFVLADPFLAPARAAATERGAYVTQPGSWQLNLHAPSGDLAEIIRAPIPRKEITRALRMQVRSDLVRNHPHTPAFVRLFDQLQPADSASAIVGIHSARDGSLWVLRWHPPRRDVERTYDVISRSGSWLGTVRVPESVGEVLDIAEDRVLTVWYDSLDVPHVRVYRWIRSP
jgi:hypothetical protein